MINKQTRILMETLCCYLVPAKHVERFQDLLDVLRSQDSQDKQWNVRGNRPKHKFSTMASSKSTEEHDDTQDKAPGKIVIFSPEMGSMNAPPGWCYGDFYPSIPG